MRKDWDWFFMDLANFVANQSTCVRRQVGAVAVEPETKRVLALGFNGAPPGVDHCIDVGCYRQQKGVLSGQREELCFAVHAEQNLVATAARFGVSLVGARVYTLVKPCITCLKLLVSAGVEEVVYAEDYPVEESLYDKVVRQSGIRLKPFCSWKGAGQ